LPVFTTVFPTKLAVSRARMARERQQTGRLYVFRVAQAST
jgi:hypothetical protein